MVTPISQEAISEAVQKLSNFLGVLSSSASRDFLQPGVVELIRRIREEATAQRDALLKAANETLPPLRDALETARTVDDNIASYLEILGVLQNSSEAENPFEAYQPIATIVSKLTDSPAQQLILSYGWNYIPNAKQSQLKWMEGFTFIGLPASEVQNPLILPLAGHEIGHSVWERRKSTDPLKSLLQELTPCEKVEDPDHDDENNVCAMCLGKSYLEEIFCDFIAFFIFGGSYLRALNYWLRTQQMHTRDYRYPGWKKRLQLLNDVASANQIKEKGFVPLAADEKLAETLPTNTRNAVSTADAVVDAAGKHIAEFCSKLCTEHGVKLPRSSAVRYVAHCFKLHFPPDVDQSISVGEIICGSWRYTDGLALSEKADPVVLAYLNNITLKTLEMLEVRQIQCT